MVKKTILIVDDEKDLLKLLQYNLAKEGYGVLLAETGETGLELARIKKPDLVVLDLMLPTIDGLEVCRILKRDSSVRHIPILILTAKSSEVDQVVGLEMGASDYLTKPFSIKVLLARIKNLLKTNVSQNNDTESLVSGPLRLDEERLQFTIKGKPVLLTKKEFQILSVLMRRAEKVVSRETLVETVWGVGTLVSPASVNMHMKALRDKLGMYRHCVQTVRGSGFRFTKPG